MHMAPPFLRPLAVVVAVVAGVVSCGSASAFALPSLAPANVLYVSAAGADRNAGTARRPLQTIGAALGRARPGTTVIVRGGVYPTRIDATQSGTQSAPIVIRPASGTRPVITGLLRIRASHLVFTGLRFVGRTSANPDGVLIDIQGADITVAHSELRNAAMSAVIVGDSSDVKILSNWIHDNGTHVVNGIPQDHGIYLSGSTNGVIANNIIDHNLGFGVHLYPGAVSTLVTCNTIVANGATAGGKAAGIVVGGSGSSGNTIVNNVLAWNGETAVRSLEPLGSGNAVFNNLAFADGAGDFPPAFSAGLTEHDNVVASPGFVNAGNRDYRLRARSVARGRALASFLPVSDYLGRRRLSGAGSALGALQAP
jgi:parallel beta-helix repeat protein